MNERTEAPQVSPDPAPATAGSGIPLDFSVPPKPIADFVARPDFPECVLGEHLDIGGSTGIVVGIVKQSIKLRSPEGITRSFNSYNLRRIYGPRPEPAPESTTDSQPALQSMDLPDTPPQSPAREPSAPPPPPPKPEMIENPDFTQPVVAISELIADPDFPKSAFGRHVDIGGYTGVVVAILNESLRVRSPQGTSRNYNSTRLRAIYGKAK